MTKCITTRPGKECFLMGKSMCTLYPLTCLPVVDKCDTCKHVDPMGYCNVYISPKARWSLLGGCPLNTNRVVKEEEKKRINPLKASKKSKGK